MKNEIAYLQPDRVIPFSELHPNVANLFQRGADYRYDVLVHEPGMVMVQNLIRPGSGISGIEPTSYFPFDVLKILHIANIEKLSRCEQEFIQSTSAHHICGIFLIVQGRTYFILTKLLSDESFVNQHGFDIPTDSVNLQ